ncbi:ABC-type cobalt transport system, permease component CbiQ [Rubidibacter lacunae KORDI 51-2]|uniref:ABC-type cobalt transport system, permease component CbiQ n=1 Tax=Rubidibacter lacunae KORDI 51-2 TaxID=582515 RepID=U5DP65_9CHRO|nr:CbiQ family ECF transporter T component [Rubidibacter lacunae]ERN42404.1 ABC-type cobalt transport system, permease component CbiQ [Rubidibacter lacunae KORDI 51-2]
MDLLRSLPLGLYLEHPVTWMHRLDARVKFIWLMGFLLTPILANAAWRIGLVGLLMLLALAAGIPLRVWKQQLGWLLVLCSLVFVLTCIFNDGLAASTTARLPALDLDLPQPGRYDYIVVSTGKIRVTQRSLELGILVSTLIFTVLYSSSLYLLTTAPEEIAAGLEALMRPLRYLKVPVTEVALTLTLSLRFIPLVLEEIQNLARSIGTRAIDWKQLGLRRSIQLWLLVAERLLANLLLRAEQIAIAMDVRGFTSPDTHRVRWHDLRLRSGDWLAALALVVFLVGRAIWGNKSA